MRILTVTDSKPSPRLAAACIASILLVFGLLSGPGRVDAQSSTIRCSLTENGGPARGSFSVERAGKTVASGSCGTELSVPPGRYKVTATLDGVLDTPSRSVDVQAIAGKSTPVALDFETGVLEVRIESKEARGTGLVTVNRGSKRIGTLGAGVAARLSAGDYEVVVRLGGVERRYAVELRAGQRRLVRAQF
ncbi:MAG: hypothetical protein ACN4G0_05190 [Polyangiales bacterium]